MIGTKRSFGNKRLDAFKQEIVGSVIRPPVGSNYLLEEITSFVPECVRKAGTFHLNSGDLP